MRRRNLFKLLLLFFLLFMALPVLAQDTAAATVAPDIVTPIVDAPEIVYIETLPDWYIAERVVSWSLVIVLVMTVIYLALRSNTQMRDMVPWDAAGKIYEDIAGRVTKMAENVHTPGEWDDLLAKLATDAGREFLAKLSGQTPPVPPAPPVS